MIDNTKGLQIRTIVWREMPEQWNEDGLYLFYGAFGYAVGRYFKDKEGLWADINNGDEIHPLYGVTHYAELPEPPV